ncbi:MAG: c-type cytochrome, partial [Candidatus Omnitrophica bacterium]|nr:c-type cytochrome [Candidatus Omnitrophota bacterium]
MAAFDNARVAQNLFACYDTLSPDEKAETVLTLSARRSTAQALFAVLKKGSIPKRDVTAFAARQLQRVLGPAFVDFWGPVAQPAEDKQADMAKFKRLLTDEVLARADVSNGRALFERTCLPCHTLYGQGGKIGPDLTGSNRANLDYILT